MKLKLHWQILIAIVLAAGAGWAAGAEGGIFGLRFYDVFDFVGTLFINALKMLIVPLIAMRLLSGDVLLAKIYARPDRNYWPSGRKVSVPSSMSGTIS